MEILKAFCVVSNIYRKTCIQHSRGLLLELTKHKVKATRCDILTALGPMCVCVSPFIHIRLKKSRV